MTLLDGTHSDSHSEVQLLLPALFVEQSALLRQAGLAQAFSQPLAVLGTPVRQITEASHEPAPWIDAAFADRTVGRLKWQLTSALGTSRKN